MAFLTTNSVNGSTRNGPNQTPHSIPKTISGKISKSTHAHNRSVQELSTSREPSRSPSIDSLASQDGEIDGHSVPSLESHEVFATQFQPSNPRQSLKTAPPASTSNISGASKFLLAHLGKVGKQKGSQKLQEQKDINPASSPSNGPPSSGLGTRAEDESRQCNNIPTAGSPQANPVPRETWNPTRARSQISTSPHSLGASRTQQKISCSEPVTLTNDSQNEVTSFQVQPSSSLETIENNTGNPGQCPQSSAQNTTLVSSQATSPARTQKNSNNDPWSGMKRLRRRDVFIPLDQEKLLSRPDSCVPPDVGYQMPQGHVPSDILRQWNAKMTELFMQSRKKHASSQKEASYQELENLPQGSSKQVSEDESDSDSESMTSWSQSPPQNIRRLQAPPDSPARLSKDRKQVGVTGTPINQEPGSVGKSNGQMGYGMHQPETTASKGISSTPEPGVTIIIDRSQDQDGQPTSLELPSVLGDEVNDSDDSGLETSIPQPLNMESRAEFLDPTSFVSPNIDVSSTAHVQIFNTPAPPLKSAAARRIENASTHERESATQKSSENSNKSSLQFICNSLDTSGVSSGSDRQLQDAQRPIVADSQNTVGDGEVFSSPYHQDSQRLLEIIPESSIRSTSMPMHTQLTPTRHESSSQPLVIEATLQVKTVEKNSKRRADQVDTNDDERPRKRQELMSTKANGERSRLDAANGLIDRPRHPVTSIDDAFVVYDMFKRTYPKYAGDFHHFQFLCNELQMLHHRKALHSSLWDEYIMRYKFDYGTYVHRCISNGEGYETYPDFFRSRFTKPSFRKRNLTPRALEIVASSLGLSHSGQNEAKKASQPVENIEATSVLRHTFLSSSADSNSARRFMHSTSSDSEIVLDDRPQQANVGVRIISQVPSPGKGSTKVDVGVQVNLDLPMPPARQQNSGGGTTVIPEIQETQRPDLEDVDMVDNEDEDEEAHSDYHDSAIVELGVEARHQTIDDEDRDAHAVNAEILESRIRLISRMQRADDRAVQALLKTEVPSAPERQDESSPFKIWARDYYNIASERRRRGGFAIPLDEDGIIVLEKFPRRMAERGTRTQLPPKKQPRHRAET